MENQQEEELFRKCPEISLKIHSLYFGNGMYGNVTSLEHRESIKGALDIILKFCFWLNFNYQVNIGC